MRKRRNILVSLFVVYSLFNSNLPLSYASQEYKAGRDHLFVSAPGAFALQHGPFYLEGLLSGMAREQIAREGNAYACFSLCITELLGQANADAPDSGMNHVGNVYGARKLPAADTISHTEELKPDEGFVFLRSDLSPPFDHVT